MLTAGRNGRTERLLLSVVLFLSLIDKKRIGREAKTSRTSASAEYATTTVAKLDVIVGTWVLVELGCEQVANLGLGVVVEPKHATLNLVNRVTLVGRVDKTLAQENHATNNACDKKLGLTVLACDR